MKKIKINGETYRIPTGTPDITLADFIFYENQKGTTLEKEVGLVSKMTGIPEEIFYQAEKSLYLKVRSQMDGLFTLAKNQDPATIIQVQGEKYYHNDFAEICLAQYVDIDFRMGEHKEPDGVDDETGETREKLNVAVYPYILAILFLKAGEKYDSKICAKRAKLFEQIPLDQALGTMNFFLSKNAKLKRIARHLEKIKDIQTKVTASKRSSPNNGVG